jgi:hypothetical protein
MGPPRILSFLDISPFSIPPPHLDASRRPNLLHSRTVATSNSPHSIRTDPHHASRLV